jgi:signal transduction histidine kinase
MTLKPITDETGKFTNWISIQRDISAKKERELERERLIQELTQNNNDLRQFSYITTHNLRAPLTNLLGLVDLIDLDHVSDERTRKMVEGFAESTHQLNETLNDLLSILIVKDKANIQQTNIVLQDTFQETITELNYSIKQSEAEIITDFKQAPTLYFNQDYLKSIFLNLISNSIRYAHPNRKPIIQIRAKKLANHTELTFEDNGLGMNMQYVKDRIFGLRQRFHDHPNSKGIGLYLVHAQITTLGGTISVSSEENIGTTFTIILKNCA